MLDQLDQLDRLADEASALHNRLVLVVGKPGAGKSGLLRQLADRRSTPVLNLGIEFSRRMAALPKRQRALQATTVLRDTATARGGGQTLIADNLEVLFDRGLQMDPLDALRRLSHGRTLVVAWPGTVAAGRLTYAPPEHPEHQDFPATGLVLFQLP